MCATQFRPLLSLLLVVALAAAEDCDKSKCPGPLAYYGDLNCKPIYEKKGDCCAVRYDCSHWNERSADKCYVNDREYAVGEKLKDEDARPCDIGCTCVKGYHNVAVFNCAIVDCFSGPPKPGCHFKQDVLSCCRGEEVCPASVEETIKCEVEGKTYIEGDAFSPSGEPDLSCRCQEGYKGENVEPFCKKIKNCGTELTSGFEIRENCAPVYYSNQAPTTSCSVFYRCQNDNDTVIHGTNEKSSEEKSDKSDSKEDNDGMKCKFGNLKMHLGDELNQATDYNSVCVKCVCEVPPIPTCQRLPDEECDVTKHPPFH